MCGAVPVHTAIDINVKHVCQRVENISFCHSTQHTSPTIPSSLDANSLSASGECQFPSFYTAPLLPCHLVQLWCSFVTLFHYSPLFWLGTSMFRCNFKDISEKIFFQQSFISSEWVNTIPSILKHKNVTGF